MHARVFLTPTFVSNVAAGFLIFLNDLQQFCSRLTAADGARPSYGICGVTTRVAAHEAGHMMGLDNRYEDLPEGGSKPIKGWKGNIMAESEEGKVQERNITEIIRGGKTIKELAVDWEPGK